MKLDTMDKIVYAFLAGLVVFYANDTRAIEHVYADLRYLPDGVAIARDSSGRIKRSNIPRVDFANIHPCPSNLLSTTVCEGWEIDHIIPLACRGRDAVENMQWLDDETKALKDLFERRIYAQAGWSSKGCFLEIIPLKVTP